MNTKGAKKENAVITLTFGERAENHKGMQILGSSIAEGEGFQVADLERIQQRVISECDTEWIEMDSGDSNTEMAVVLVIRQGVSFLLAEPAERLFEEQKALPYDKKALMYGRVVNKNARWNLCFDDTDQEPDYEAGKGRVISFARVPLLDRLRERIGNVFGDKATGLKVESNYYYDAEQCGIGFHGDSERRKVIGVRLGTVGLPLYYQWYHEGVAVGDRIEIELKPGDVYLMSEKEVGTDWKKRSAYTLRHAVGKKFI